MSLVSLAKTVFSTGPDDSLLVLDVYNKSDSSPVNSIQDAAADIPFDKVLGTILKGQTDPKSILDNIKQSDLIKKLSIEDTITRCCGKNSALKSLTQDLSSASKELFSIENKLKNSVEFSLNGIVSKILPTGVSDARAVVNMVNNLTSNNMNGVFKDLGAVSGLVTSFTRQATAVGLSGVFTSLSNSINDKNALISSVGDLLPKATATGNADLFLEMASSSIGKQIKSIFPNVVASVIKGVELPIGLQQKSYSDYYKKLNTGFKVVDSNWSKYTRSGNNVTNVINGIKVAGARNFIKVLKSNIFSKTSTPNETTAIAQVGFPGPFDPSTASINELADHETNNDKFLLMMQQFKEKTVSEQLRSTFPSIKITPDPIHEDLNVLIT